jgi:hypothetical protein
MITITASISTSVKPASIGARANARRERVRGFGRSAVVDERGANLDEFAELGEIIAATVSSALVRSADIDARALNECAS